MSRRQENVNSSSVLVKKYHALPPVPDPNGHVADWWTSNALSAVLVRQLVLHMYAGGQAWRAAGLETSITGWRQLTKAYLNFMEICVVCDSCRYSASILVSSVHSGLRRGSFALPPWKV